MFRRFSAAAVAASLLLLVTSGCGGGSDQAAADSVRTLAANDDGTENGTDNGTDNGTNDVAAEFGVDANEAVAEANAIDGDTDGDGVLSQAERFELLNESMLEFSQCVRDEGLESFEDITLEMFTEGDGPQTFFRLMIERGLNPATDEGGAIMGSCSESLQRLAANAPEPSDETLEQNEAKAVEWAACLREKGVEDFPDPNFSDSLLGYGPEIRNQFDFSQPPVSDAIATCAAEGKSLLGGS